MSYKNKYRFSIFFLFFFSFFDKLRNLNYYSECVSSLMSSLFIFKPANKLYKQIKINKANKPPTTKEYFFWSEKRKTRILLWCQLNKDFCFNACIRLWVSYGLLVSRDQCQQPTIYSRRPEEGLGAQRGTLR